MKIELTRLEKLAFAAVAILAAAVVALVLFGCSSPAFDADAGTDAGAEPDSGVDSGADTDTANPCPFACTMSADACLEISGEIVAGDCPEFDGAVCCYLETWPDSGV